MLVRRHGRTVATGLATLVLAVTVASCGADSDRTEVAGSDVQRTETPDAGSTNAAPTPSEATSPDATATATPSETVAQTPSPSEETREPGLRGALLTAAEVPGLNDEFTWTEKATRRREGSRPFGTCHQFAMTSIGAMRVVARTYVPADGSAGADSSHLVAQFADEMTAKRAFEVLKSWRGQCEEQLGKHERVDVGRLQDVPLEAPDAVGHWYLLGYGPAGDIPEEAYFDAQGLTRVGNRISVLSMRAVTQDYNYPVGEEPMVAAVQAAARQLG